MHYQQIVYGSLTIHFCKDRLQENKTVMNKDMFFQATFKVTDNVAHQFQEWMEKDHFPKMHATGCFAGEVGAIQKFLDMESAPGCVLITYIHRPKSMDAWKRYNMTPAYRVALKDEFKNKWGTWINIYIYTVVMMVGYEKDIPHQIN